MNETKNMLTVVDGETLMDISLSKKSSGSWAFSRRYGTIE